jgi:tripartite-type tricarboxylate transporter receptor subunit TctC
MKHFKWIALGLALIITPIMTPPAQAQDYPSRVVTMIVPFSAGGPADALARGFRQVSRQILIGGTDQPWRAAF